MARRMAWRAQSVSDPQRGRGGATPAERVALGVPGARRGAAVHRHVARDAAFDRQRDEIPGAERRLARAEREDVRRRADEDHRGCVAPAAKVSESRVPVVGLDHRSLSPKPGAISAVMRSGLTTP